MPAIYLAAIILAIIRVCGHKSPAFQAVAHMFEGGLIAASCMAWKFVTPREPHWVGTAEKLMCVFVVLALIELACFLFLPKGP